eukprot:g824.t1
MNAEQIAKGFGEFFKESRREDITCRYSCQSTEVDTKRSEEKEANVGDDYYQGKSVSRANETVEKENSTEEVAFVRKSVNRAQKRVRELTAIRKYEEKKKLNQYFSERFRERRQISNPKIKYMDFCQANNIVPLLSLCDLDDVGSHALRIKTLALANENISDKQCSAIAVYFEDWKAPNLTKIDLRSNAFSNTGLQALIEVLPSSIEDIDLSGNSMINVELHTCFGEVVEKAWKKKRAKPWLKRGKLNSIRLDHCKLRSMQVRKLLYSLIRFDNYDLKVLSLKDNDINDDIVVPASERSFDLSENEEDDTSDKKTLYPGIPITDLFTNPNFRNVRILDLSWNRLTDKAVLRLIHYLTGCRTLESLNLAHNNFGGDKQLNYTVAPKKTTTVHDDDDDDPFYRDDALPTSCIDAIFTLISSCGTLAQLDLSYNFIGPKGFWLIINALSIATGNLNRSLKSLDLSGSTPCPSGMNIFAELVLHPDFACNVRLVDCNFSNQLSECFDVNDPNGEYHCDLGNLYDREVAARLVKYEITQYGRSLDHAKLNGKQFVIAENVDEISSVSDDYIHNILPRQGNFECQFTSHEAISHVERNRNRSTINGRVYNSLKKATKMCFNRDSDRVLFLEAFANVSTHLLSVDKVKELVDLLDKAEMVNALEHLYASVIDLHEWDRVIGSKLHTKQRKRLQKRLGALYDYSDSNPTGHYSLDLANHNDFYVAQQIMLTDVEENLRKKENNTVDVSQFGNYSNFRNAVFNDKAIELSPHFTLKHEGFLSFDYVSTLRPPADAECISSERLQNELEYMAVQYNNRDDQLSYLRRILSTRYYFSSQTVTKVIFFFVESRHCLEAFVTLFSRIEDEENIVSILRKFNRNEQAILFKRLGYVALFNPFQPDGWYDLNFSVHEERLVAELLIWLSFHEGGGKRWIGLTCTYFTHKGRDAMQTNTFLKPWLESLPKNGFLQGEFKTPENMDVEIAKRVQSTRQECAKRLGWEFGTNKDNRENSMKRRRRTRHRLSKAGLFTRILHYFQNNQ